MPASFLDLYELFEFEKADLLLHLLQADQSENKNSHASILILVKTRDGVHALASTLQKAGWNAESIHAQKKPELREQILADFSSGKISTLVTTAAMASELSLPRIQSLIHYDFPSPGIDPTFSLTPESFRAFATTQDKAELRKYRENGDNLPIQPSRAEGFPYATKDLVKKAPKKSGYRSKPLQNKKPKLIAKQTGQKAPRGRKPNRG